jgi:2TM domain-containing protein
MNNYQQHEDALWKVAKKRAAFKWSFSAYVFAMFSLVCIWLFSTGPLSYFWPIWPIIGWGIGILFQYLAAYQGNNLFTAEQEYQRLKNQQNNQL